MDGLLMTFGLFAGTLSIVSSTELILDIGFSHLRVSW